eukprot:g407.t1
MFTLLQTGEPLAHAFQFPAVRTLTTYFSSTVFNPHLISHAHRIGGVTSTFHSDKRSGQGKKDPINLYHHDLNQLPKIGAAEAD